jgi:hypothetical protein
MTLLAEAKFEKSPWSAGVATTAKVTARVLWQPLASVARSVTLLLLGALGVPLTTPVAVLSVNPAGSVPLASAKV